MLTITIDKKENPRILVLEDDPTRIKWFKENLIGIVTDYAETADQAIQLYDRNEYSLMFLDHDLGGKVFVDTRDKNTGSEFARHVSKVGTFKGLAVIHSFNEFGVKNMYSLLWKRAMIAPFKTFKINIKND